jgi:hypothetical protein
MMFLLCINLLFLFQFNSQLAQDSTIQSVAPLSDTLEVSALDSLPSIEKQEPSIAYKIEKYSERAYKAAKETIKTLHVPGRFPIHIIIFVVCGTLVVIASLDVVKQKSEE